MLVTTSFAMPESVIPFKLSFKSFVLSIIIIAVCIHLASLSVDVLSNWWRSITPAKASQEISASAPKKFRIPSMRSRGCCALDGVESEDNIEEV